MSWMFVTSLSTVERTCFSCLQRTELLFFLVLNAGRIVSKAEIMANVWPGYLVGDSNLAKQISLLRKVIEENEQDPVRIVTVSGRGYMFREKVVRLDTSDNETGGWVRRPPA
jgi:DNA-binding winged helix-turn-helix (wHTH) protein